MIQILLSQVLTEAVAALMWHSIRLERADLEKFKALKVSEYKRKTDYIKFFIGGRQNRF